MRLFRLFVLFILLFSIGTLSYLLFFPPLLPKTEQMYHEKEALLLEVDALKKQISELKSEVHLLSGKSKESKLYLEKIARDELGFIGKDEVLYLLEH